MALAFVRRDVVFLLKLLATEFAGKLVERFGIVLLHVPVQGRLLPAGEATDLTPVQRGWGGVEHQYKRARDEKTDMIWEIHH